MTRTFTDPASKEMIQEVLKSTVRSDIDMSRYFKTYTDVSDVESVTWFHESNQIVFWTVGPSIIHGATDVPITAEDRELWL